MNSRTPGAGVTDQGEQFDVIAERGEDAAQRVSEAFQTAGDAISDALGSAARTGELEFSQMAEAILQDLARIALEAVVISPIRAFGDEVGQSLGWSIADVLGQRQFGGPVMGGTPYLVGENGPEVFVPTGAGAIAQAGPAQIINVTIQTSGDPVSSTNQTERQLTAAIARAAAAGGRLL